MKNTKKSKKTRKGRAPMCELLSFTLEVIFGMNKVSSCPNFFTSMSVGVWVRAVGGRWEAWGRRLNTKTPKGTLGPLGGEERRGRERWGIVSLSLQ